MLKRVFLGAFLALSPFVWAQNQVSCSVWKMTAPQSLQYPAFSNVKSVDNQSYQSKDFLAQTKVDLEKALLNTQSWSATDSLIASVSQPNQMVVLSGFVSSDRYAKAALAIETNAIFELYLDGEKLKSQANASTSNINQSLTLGQGKHLLQFKLISQDSILRFATTIKTSDSDTLANLDWSVNPERTLTIHDVLDGKSISRARISPSGKYAILIDSKVEKGTGKRNAATRIYDLEKQKTLFVVRNSSTLNASWLPKTDRYYYTVNQTDGTDIYVFDLSTGEETCVASEVKDMGGITWSPTEDFIIYSSSKKADEPGDLKRIFGNDDRLPYFRTRNYLYLLDLNSGLSKPISAGNLSASLHDIRPDGKKILFSTSMPDYTQTPFFKQSLYELDLKSFTMDTLWQNNFFGGSCEYAPDGTQLLVSGSAEVFGDLGLKVDSGLTPNTFDSQLYLYNIAAKKADPLTLDFDPSIGSSFWINEQQIGFTAMAGDKVNLYTLDVKKKSIEEISLPVDVVSQVSVAKDAPIGLVSGTSVTTSQQLYSVDLKSGKAVLMETPKQEMLKNVAFGDVEEWDFVNNNGTNIQGRVYYPPNYDASKKYPVIVYYYGGTSPTSRSFGGRYPKNTWAASGYIVYVLQPSGAIGYGQNFSALHVNGWGRDAIDDIIDGTKKFLEAHPTADADNVGCIGASYGGFTTMMLQTRTDIFKTAISHAGISDITSYWGEGYWGYSYSAVATRYSYPWNRKDVYVENSPLFHADKFQNSILLLHGTSDTNVPVGESLQYYAALKILGKDVEMVLVDGQDHHILDYNKRLKWHDTIVSWFDLKLKDQPAQWNDMYPDKNL